MTDPEDDENEPYEKSGFWNSEIPGYIGKAILVFAILAGMGFCSKKNDEGRALIEAAANGIRP